MISRWSFFLCGWTWDHPGRIVWASAVLFFAFGLIGPPYGAFPAQVARVSGRGAVALGFALWLFVTLVRRKRPGFSLGQLVSGYPAWSERHVLGRAGFALLFASMAGMMASLGFTLGALAIYVFWRAT